MHCKDRQEAEFRELNVLKLCMHHHSHKGFGLNYISLYTNIIVIAHIFMVGHVHKKRRQTILLYYYVMMKLANA